MDGAAKNSVVNRLRDIDVNIGIGSQIAQGTPMGCPSLRRNANAAKWAQFLGPNAIGQSPPRICHQTSKKTCRISILNFQKKK